MTRPLVAIVVALLAGTSLTAGELQPATLVVQRHLEQALGEIASVVDPHEDVHLEVVAEQDREWIRSLAATALAERGVQLVVSDEAPRLQIVAHDVSTRYEMIAESDSVRRIVTVDVRAHYVAGRTMQPVTPGPFTDTVICSREDARINQSQQHHATHGEIPPEAASFWDDVLEPVVFVAAAVATVVLLFTVRSQ